jgi:hypothetical protein
MESRSVPLCSNCSRGAPLAGSQYLGAIALDDGTLTKVWFHLSGRTLNDALIATTATTDPKAYDDGRAEPLEL